MLDDPTLQPNDVSIRSKATIGTAQTEEYVEVS